MTSALLILVAIVITETNPGMHRLEWCFLND